MINYKLLTLVMATILVLPLGVQVGNSEHESCDEAMTEKECKKFLKNQEKQHKKEAKNPPTQFTACDTDSNGAIDAGELHLHESNISENTWQGFIGNVETNVNSTPNGVIDTNPELELLNQVLVNDLESSPCE